MSRYECLRPDVTWTLYYEDVYPEDTGTLYYVAIILTTEEPICGNGILDGCEVCDVSSDDGIYGCATGCMEVLDDFLCTGDPSVCVE